VEERVKGLFSEELCSKGVRFVIENLKPEVIEAMLDAMPIEISFVDENDEVKYFNKNGDRIFPRPRSIVGKKVQQCHPQKSVHKVLQILEAFKNGKKDVAEFWINLKGKQIYIRYFPVQDKDGKYLGTLEVSQDITGIKKIEGEKRLLDWK
jgi:PAS domain S-box-containing protein